MISLLDYLNDTRPSEEVIEAATVSFLSENSGDLPPQIMRVRLVEAFDNGTELQGILDRLQKSPYDRTRLCISYLESEWANSEMQIGIRAAFKGVAGKMPATESALLAIVAMYGMYLLANHVHGGTVTTYRKLEDGRWTEYKKVERSAPSTPVGVIKNVLSALGK